MKLLGWMEQVAAILLVVAVVCLLAFKCLEHVVGMIKPNPVLMSIDSQYQSGAQVLP